MIIKATTATQTNILLVLVVVMGGGQDVPYMDDWRSARWARSASGAGVSPGVCVVVGFSPSSLSRPIFFISLRFFIFFVLWQFFQNFDIFEVSSCVWYFSCFSMFFSCFWLSFYFCVTAIFLYFHVVIISSSFWFHALEITCYLEVLPMLASSCSNLSLNVEGQGAPGHAMF